MDRHSKTVNSKSRLNVSMIQTTLLNRATKGVEEVEVDSGVEEAEEDFVVEVVGFGDVVVEEGGGDFIRIKNNGKRVLCCGR